MEFKFDEIREILNFEPWNKKRRMYELFKLDYNMYTNISEYLTEEGMDIMKRKSSEIRKAISILDCDIDKHFVFSVDK